MATHRAKLQKLKHIKSSTVYSDVVFTWIIIIIIIIYIFKLFTAGCFSFLIIYIFFFVIYSTFSSVVGHCYMNSEIKLQSPFFSLHYFSVVLG